MNSKVEFNFWHFTNAVIRWHAGKLCLISKRCPFSSKHTMDRFWCSGDRVGRYERLCEWPTSSSSLSSLITKFTFYFGRCDQMFVYWHESLGCLGAVIGGKRQNKRLFGIERDRLVYIHCTHVIQSKSVTHPLGIASDSPILLPRTQIKWAKWIIESFSSALLKILDSGWFNLRSANEILNRANYLRGFGKHRVPDREISSKLVLLSNFKLSIKFTECA